MSICRYIVYIWSIKLTKRIRKVCELSEISLSDYLYASLLNNMLIKDGRYCFFFGGGAGFWRFPHLKIYVGRSTFKAHVCMYSIHITNSHIGEVVLEM